MVDSTLSVGITGSSQLEKAMRALIGAQASIPTDSSDTIRELAQSLAQRASAAVLGEPVHGTKHTGLRAIVAAGVGTQEIPGGTLVTTSMPESNEAIIPRGFDTAVGGSWRHPLFGNVQKWFKNYGAFSWFMGTMNDGVDEGRSRLVTMLERTAARINAQTQA